MVLKGPTIIRVEIKNYPILVGLGARHFAVFFHKELEIAKKQKLPSSFTSGQKQALYQPFICSTRDEPTRTSPKFVAAPLFSCLTGVDPNQPLGPVPKFLTRREMVGPSDHL